MEVASDYLKLLTLTLKMPMESNVDYQSILIVPLPTRIEAIRFRTDSEKIG
jgi:hypothetical protein